MSVNCNNADPTTIGHTAMPVNVAQNRTANTIFSLVFNELFLLSCSNENIEHFISNHLFVILITIVTLGAVYYWIILPINRVKDFTEIGYNGIGPKRLKAHVIKKLQEQREVGELPPPFPNGWIPLIESDAVKPGQSKHVSALGEHFAIFRSEGGEAYILNAYCPHLGANMAVGGAVYGDCIECPFHGWRFSGQDGKCKSIPYTEKIPELIQVKKWHCHDVNGFIFVWFHADEEEPIWNLKEIPEIRSGKWIYRGRNDYTVNCHIQEIPENGCDVVHLSAIHELSVFSGSTSVSIPNNIFSWVMGSLLKHKWSAIWERQEEASHKTRIKLRHDVYVLNKFTMLSMDAVVQQIGPAYVELLLHTSFGPILIIQAVLPEGPLQQRVIHRVYCPWYLSLYGSFVLFGESIMFERDVLIWNQKKYLNKPFLVKGDGKINQYRKWYSQFFSEHSKTYQECRKDLYDCYVKQSSKLETIWKCRRRGVCFNSIVEKAQTLLSNEVEDNDSC